MLLGMQWSMPHPSLLDTTKVNLHTLMKEILFPKELFVFSELNL